MSIVVAVKIFGISIQIETYLEAEIQESLTSKIYKIPPMNIISCSPQDKFHKEITKTEILSSIVYRLRKMLGL